MTVGNADGRRKLPRRIPCHLALRPHRHALADNPAHAILARKCFLQNSLADGEGFEPPLDSRPERFSRPPP